ncbi:hypothetical protein CTZ27_37335 [Streptomyces griseocarneus]|nr:hypothetical protein CTZ27_37335 [Streptomyces griseocarneus]
MTILGCVQMEQTMMIVPTPGSPRCSRSSMPQMAKAIRTSRQRRVRSSVRRYSGRCWMRPCMVLLAG